MLRASDVLKEAARIIDQREVLYGDFSIMAFRNAAIQTIVNEVPTTAEQWCLNMAITKLARIYTSPTHDDNIYDAIGYLAQYLVIVQSDDDFNGKAE